ncbi:MAG TPA: terminase small subunit [Planctomycetota bacterium]|nr:terminase small subunit [Planctomycetota bacterium]
MAKVPTNPRPLNERQLRFVEHYLADPNATKAAKKAGYTGTDAVLASTGHQLLRNPKVAEVLAGRGKPAHEAAMSEADEIRAFWKATMRDKQQDPKDRLKASELLGKVNAMFVEKTKHEGELTITVRRGNDAPGALAPKETEDA